VTSVSKERSAIDCHRQQDQINDIDESIVTNQREKVHSFDTEVAPVTHDKDILQIRSSSVLCPVVAYLSKNFKNCGEYLF
jgi:hypothetical protein